MVVLKVRVEVLHVPHQVQQVQRPPRVLLSLTLRVDETMVIGPDE